jgi:hypothetical protein
MDGGSMPSSLERIKKQHVCHFFKAGVEALMFVSGLRKYGDIVEGAKDGDYFTAK